jgi:DinB superfamily
MDTKETIEFALALSDKAVLSAIDEMRDSPTTFPTANGGCHPLWVLGHLALIEGSIPAILKGEENPAAKWSAQFGQGSVPVADAAAYPPFAEVREKYRQLRERNLALLRSLSEDDLDKPTQAPPKGREREFATYGRSFMTLALHQMLHRSHITDARRALRPVAA